MRIAVCIKRVPITGGRILLTEDSRAINTQHLGFTMSPHEECGVEEAARLIEANKGDSVVFTLGPPEAVEQLRDAMALGIDRAIHLLTAPARAQGAQNESQEWDAEATAAALLEAIRADEAANGPFDIIFFGNESADCGGRRAAEGGRSMSVLVLMDGTDASRQTLTLARLFGEPRSLWMNAVDPFAPDALAGMLARAADELSAAAVFAAGTERGNEVI